jgi:hypothetical protein
VVRLYSTAAITLVQDEIDRIDRRKEATRA